ncbi:MAG: LPS export ABC transporter ATP-binding protein [Alphaproteobacteria bacterium]|nr:LPS export ABC transporter ATP-binding protein [Alphaproteobacteria bacterium]
MKTKTPPKTGLVAKDLSKSYGKRPILLGVDIDVQRGEAVGLLGPNGAGKTTCFGIMSGLISGSGGKIFLDGVDITRMPMYMRARHGIGYLPQEASIFRGMNVEDNIRAILEIVEKNQDTLEDRLNTLLDEFQIAHLRYAPSLALSGGERRRVEIARSLAAKPSFLLLDEPLAGIDPIAMQELREMIFHLKEKNIGILITDHNVRETLEIVDRAYILHGGEVLCHGDKNKIISDKNVRRVYLGERFVM